MSVFGLLTCILMCSGYVPTGHAVSITDQTQQKLRSIVQWLDTVTDATVFDYIYRVNRGAGLNLYQGDIKGYVPRSSQHRTATRNHNQLWNTRVVPYLIDSSFDSASRKDIIGAINEYHAKTCIRFVPRTSESDFIHFKQISGCYSNIGRTGGEQEISLMGACLKLGTAVHEIMHALGFWHEQSRPDRDSWVQVITRNIQAGKEYNFDKLPAEEVDTLGVQYDYGSIMHYSKYAFSKNGNPTILPTRQTDEDMGQRIGLSGDDVKRINTLYRCDIQIPTTEKTTPSYQTKPKETKPPITKPPQPQPPQTQPPQTQPPRTQPPPTQPPHTQPPPTQPPQTQPPPTQPPQTQPPQTQPPPTQPPPTQPSQTQPPPTQPPPTQPPQTQPPQTQPPPTQPPQTQPPPTQPPQTQPPQTQPPQTQPPQTQPPQTQPPQTQPPPTQPPPPQTQPPQTQPPQTQPPQTQPPQTQPPQTQPPPTQPPPTQPPQTQPPQTQPPQTQPPQTQPPPTQPPQTQPIFTYPPAGWTPWSLWTPCDLECRRSRYRFCLNYDSSFCPGEKSESSTCPSPCRSAVSLGCWKMDPVALSVPSVEGLVPSLSDSHRQRTEAVRKCADYASGRGFTVFALYDDGQCLTGPTAQLDFGKDGVSNECNYRAKGSPSAASVFSFETDVDGGWSLWTGWSQCTATCGYGRQYRYRRCDNPAPQGNGEKCVGFEQEFFVCEIQECQVLNKCGRRFHAGGPGTSGLIWVREYDNFMECEYNIRTNDPAASISIMIQDMDVEYSRGCIYDTLMLFDGSSMYSPMVGAFCGRGAARTFESTSNSVFLKFESDETNTGEGFAVLYNINSRSRKACARPPHSNYVTVYRTGNMVGDRAYYQCHSGFRLVGHSPITCLDQPGFAVWDDVFPRCVPARKKRETEELSSQVCTFDESLCGLTNTPTSDIKWRIQSDLDMNGMGVAMTSNQTNGTQSNLYLHSESTRLQAPGDVAQIRTRVTSPAREGQCLLFRYSVDGGSETTFGVYQIIGHKQELVWETTGPGIDTLATWAEKKINLQSESLFQVMFEAVLGNEIGSSVSLDDLLLQRGACQT